MTLRVPLFSFLLLLGVCRSAQSQSIEIAAGENFKLKKALADRGIQAFTWDDHGRAWVLSATDDRLIVSTMPNFNTEEKPVRSFQRLGHGRASVLASGDTVFIADGGAIRSFSAGESRSDGTLHLPPGNLFPGQLEISSLAWSPLGDIYFLYRSPVRQENGVGRVNLRGTEWDVVAKGTFTNLSFHVSGFAVTTDARSDSLFLLAAGLDYDRGLETYGKSDLAVKVDKPGLKPSLATIYSGSTWASANRGTWLVYDRAASRLEQFKEEEGGLKHWRTVAQLGGHSTVRDLQVGPDGAAWILVTPSDNSGSGSETAIFRLASSEAESQAGPVEDISLLNTEKLVAELGNPNAWQRDAALRILDQKNDLRTTRGLHPGTPLHKAFGEKTNDPMARVYAMLSLQRLGLLDETFLENAADDDAVLVRTWAGLLFGERNYPTGPAFQKLVKLAKDTNMVARSAAAVAARQFVSGSLAVDTPPRAMPIREVFTGGILSTLWFSTKNGSTPEFDLLFWNAVRPITAFDPAHPMGFFNGDNDAKLSLAYWVVGLITRQIAETENALKQEDGMIAMGELNPENPRMILAALRGLKNGSSNRRVTPTERSLKVLADFARSSNADIAALGEELREKWRAPVK